jgi:hypothetical protein
MLCAVDCHRCFDATYLVPMQSLFDIFPHSINLLYYYDLPAPQASNTSAKDTTAIIIIFLEIRLWFIDV